MKTAVAIIVAVAAVAAIIWFGLGMERVAAPFAEDTRRLTFERSRAHQSGTNSAIADYCLNMRRESDPNAKLAIARWLVSEASTFQGRLSADAEACRAEAQALLN